MVVGIEYKSGLRRMVVGSRRRRGSREYLSRVNYQRFLEVAMETQVRVRVVCGHRGGGDNKEILSNKGG